MRNREREREKKKEEREALARLGASIIERHAFELLARRGQPARSRG